MLSSTLNIKDLGTMGVGTASGLRFSKSVIIAQGSMMLNIATNRVVTSGTMAV